MNYLLTWKSYREQICCMNYEKSQLGKFSHQQKKIPTMLITMKHKVYQMGFKGMKSLNKHLIWD
jgi:hypothetical protein